MSGSFLLPLIASTLLVQIVLKTCSHFLFQPPLSKQAVSKEVKENLRITALDLDWEDSMKFKIAEEDIEKVVHFIENGRKIGSVLVHCAQVPKNFLSEFCLIYKTSTLHFIVLSTIYDFMYFLSIYFLPYSILIPGQISLRYGCFCLFNGEAKYGHC